MAAAASKLGERTLVLERVFDAPLELVWRCWTEGEHLRQWSCPRGFKIPRAEGKFVVGGRWHITMRTPEGNDLGVGGEYREIVPLKRFAMTHAWDDESGKPRHWTAVTVTFEALGKRTKVTLVQTGFDSDESRDGHEGGWSESLDILAEHLATLRDEPTAEANETRGVERTMTVDAREFTMSRSFAAPRERVWRAWTDAESLARWWGPKGCTIRVLKLELRPGGLFHYAMAVQPGHEMYGRFIFREIVAPERLAFVVSFSDAAGGMTRAPFPQLGGKWPLEVLNVVTFTEQDGRTTLTLRGGPINATEEERKIFEGHTESMRQGFGGTFDQLEAFLAQDAS